MLSSLDGVAPAAGEETELTGPGVSRFDPQELFSEDGRQASNIHTFQFPVAAPLAETRSLTLSASSLQNPTV